MSEPCKHERLDDLDLCHNASQWRVAWQGALQGHRDAIGSFVAQTETLVRAEHERDAALAALERIGRVLFEHSHADTCATELSPDAGYECSCWRAGIYAALEEPS